jgi:hypothetical protein
LKNDLFYRSFVFDEIVDFFGDIEDDDYNRKQGYGVEESSQKLLDDVDVENLEFHRASFIRKISELTSVPLEVRHFKNTIQDAGETPSETHFKRRKITTAKP